MPFRPFPAMLLALPLLAAPLPLPEMAVPKTAHPPTIDGTLAPGEWDRAAACTGFVHAFDGALAKIQSTAWITYDNQYLYVAFRNYRGEALTLLTVNGRRPDDERIVYDPSNEIWISPPGVPAATYQTMVNVYPAVFDVKMIPSLGYTSKAWSGHWEVASKQTPDGWTVEARAPIRAFGPDRIPDGATWRALFATDILADGDKFRAWAPGGAFADIARHGFLHFSGDGPAFQLLDVDSVFSGNAAIAMAVSGTQSRTTPIEVSVHFNNTPELTKSLSLKPGATERFTISTPLTAADRLCEITAKSEGTTLYHQVFPITVDGTIRRPTAQVRTTPYDQPFGINASYAPLSKVLLVKLDRYYMADRAAVAGGSVRLTDPDTGNAIAERPIADFRQDYSEFPISLHNPAQSAQSSLLLSASLTAKDGSRIATAAIPVKLETPQTPWLPNEIGISKDVIPPWIPLRMQGATVAAWNKTYTLNSAGLAEKITNSGAPQLTGAMKLEAVIDGRRTVVATAKPETSSTSDAAVEMKGDSHAASLKINTETRMEFDGFVLNTMTIQPTRASVDRLSLVVTMPEAEAPYFVTTSGGWSAYHGTTPAKWDSRETSLTTMVGNFVPYIFLTDSERGFCWFADNNQGWRVNPALPAQEIERRDGQVTLRVHFINKPGPIEQPLTIRYGWMVTPQKPQPKGWRGYLIGPQHYFPQATPIFWNEADWAVSWPYYSSPFPHNYDKSRALLANSKNSGVVGCVGNIAHAIATYRDYTGQAFPALAADWGSTPGETSNGNIARSRGPNDFQLFHFDRWSKLSGLSCLYFDENYLAEDWNYLTGAAFLLPGERVQPGYSYLGLREYNKRLRYMFHDNGYAPPNLWEHTTGGQAVYSWMPDVSMEAENVEPADLENDYMEALPASRLRAIGMGRNLGSAPFIMCQADRHFQGAASQFLVNQFAGWVLAHDTLPETISYWPVLSSELELWRDDIGFVPYWKKGQGIDSGTPGILVSAHVRPGNAVLWIVNTNREDASAAITLDLARLGLDASRPVVAYDAETGELYPFLSGGLRVPVPQRLWRAVRLFQPAVLKDKQTFVADFDHEVAAAEAFGGRYPLGKTLPDPAPGGRKGNCAPLDTRLAFLARQHITSESGAISFQVRLSSAVSSGALLTLGDAVLSVVNGRLVFRAANTNVASAFPVFLNANWNEVVVSWRGRNIQITYDGGKLFTAALPAPLSLPGVGHGLDIRDNRRHIEPAVIAFGPLPGGRLDDLTMSR